MFCFASLYWGNPVRWEEEGKEEEEGIEEEGGGIEEEEEEIIMQVCTVKMNCSDTLVQQINNNILLLVMGRCTEKCALH